MQRSSLNMLTVTAGVFVMQLYASVVLAAGDADAVIGADDHHGGGYHEVDGLPQLDFSTYVTQIFWLLITFSVLYVFFAKKTLPDISGVIDKRHENIQNDLDNAEHLKEEAEKAHEAYDKILDEARQKSSDLFSNVEADIKGKSQEKLEAFRDKSMTDLQSAETKVEKAKIKAKEEMHMAAAEIAQQAAEKIIGVSTDIKQAQSAIQSISKKAA